MKRTPLKIIFLIVVTIAGIKAYLTFNNHQFEKTMKSMDEPITEIEHKRLTQNGYDIHYYVSGEANKDLIIFLHPAFSDHRAFEKQIDFFAKKYKVITIDLIGHGLSKANGSKDKIDASAKHIYEIMKAEGYAKTHLVSVSMGSLVAQYFTQQYPKSVKSLTILGGYSINKENAEVARAQRNSNLSLIARAVFSMKSFRQKVAEVSTNSPEGEALFYKSASEYERKSFMVMMGFQNVIKNRLVKSRQYPTLILTGEHDIELSKKLAKELHSEIENSEFFEIKDAGHCANMDKAEVFNERVLKFIEKVPE